MVKEMIYMKNNKKKKGDFIWGLGFPLALLFVLEAILAHELDKFYPNKIVLGFLFIGFLFDLFLGVRLLVIYCIFGWTKKGQIYCARPHLLGLSFKTRIVQEDRERDEAEEREYGTIEYQEKQKSKK